MYGLVGDLQAENLTSLDVERGMDFQLPQWTFHLSRIHSPRLVEMVLLAGVHLGERVIPRFGELEGEVELPTPDQALITYSNREYQSTGVPNVLSLTMENQQGHSSSSLLGSDDRTYLTQQQQDNI